MPPRPRTFVLAAALTLMVCAMLATAAMAAPVSKGKSTGATLSVSSGDAAAASTTLTSYGPLHVTGTGYVPGNEVTIVMTSPTATSWFGGIADGDGRIAIDNTLNSPGNYGMEAYQDFGHGQRFKLMASITFTVMPAQ